MQPTKPINQEQARAQAIEWQAWQSEQSLSYSELAKWHIHFSAIAEQFDLSEEFIMNGII